MRRHADTAYSIWSANAEADAVKVLGAKFLDDIAHAVVSGGTGRAGCFVGAWGDIKVVMDDDDVFGLEFVKMNKLADRRTGCVHEGVRFHEKNLIFTDLPLTYFCRHFLLCLEGVTTPFFL